jgi:hypothetical protein
MYEGTFHLFSSASIVEIIKSKILMWAEHMGGMGKHESCILYETPLNSMHLEDRDRNGRITFKIDLWKIDCEDVKWIEPDHVDSVAVFGITDAESSVPLKVKVKLSQCSVS